jgi:hypothetical protein
MRRKQRIPLLLEMARPRSFINSLAKLTALKTEAVTASLLLELRPWRGAVRYTGALFDHLPIRTHSSDAAISITLAPQRSGVLYY